MNRLLAALLASAAGATIAAAPAFAQNDSAAYRQAMDKIAADHKAAKQKCDALKDEDVCEEQADVARARAELAAVQKHDNTTANRNAAQRKLAEAEYELAEEKCDTMNGNAKDSCMNNAKSVRTAALAKLGGTRDADDARDARTAVAVGGSGSTAATASALAQNDSPAYRQAMDKVAADHKAAKQKCDALKEEDVCEEQADVARARAELAAVQKHDKNNTANHDAARRKLAEAEYELAEEKCDAMKGNTKDSCMDKAKSVRTAALAKLGDTRTTVGGSGSTAATAGSAGLVASTDTKDPVKAAAVEKCDERGNKTACLVENKDQPDTALERAGEKTRNAVAGVVDKTKEAGRNVADKTREVTGGAAARTERTAENVGDKTERATERAGSRTASNLSDTAITAKVKAGLAAEPDTSALAVKVETEKGVVMLSGFVDSKAEAERAEKVAKGVEGVSRVKSTIKVK
jgi:osmotically-inducible protein OsmY